MNTIDFFIRIVEYLQLFLLAINAVVLIFIALMWNKNQFKINMLKRLNSKQQPISFYYKSQK